MTLTELSVNSRKFGPFAIFVFVFVMIFFFLIKLLFSLGSNETTYNNKSTVNTTFNKISPIDFTHATSSAGFKFTLDTVEGQPVTATETAAVYFIPEAKFSLDYVDKIYVLAKAFGFDTEKVKHTLKDKNTALFQDSMQKMVIDITNYNFRYDYNFKKDSELMQDFIEPDKDQAEQRAIDFLKSFDRYPVELSKGATKAIYLKYDPISSSTAVLANQDGANMIEIDFFRPDIGPFSTFSSTYYNSANYVTMIVGTNGYRVISAQVQFFEKSDMQVGVYPLITGEEAYKRLVEGKGYAVSIPANANKDISINKMIFAYYDPDIYQQYLQPMYVFLDEQHDFVGYVPAVQDKWVLQKGEVQKPQITP